MITIRKAIKKDINAIADLWYKEEKLSSKLEPTYILKKDIKKIIIKELKKKFKKKDYIVFVAEDKEKIIASFQAWITKSYELSAMNKIGHLGSVYVEKPYRRKGITKKLLKEIIKWFKSKKLEYMDIYYLDKNNIAKKTWHKLGFKDSLIYSVKKIK